MHKNILLAVGITILFLGLAIQPSIAIPQLKKIDVEPDLEGLVAQLRILINEKFEKYENIPKVANLCNVILNKIDSFWEYLYDILQLFLEILHTVALYILIIILYIAMLPFILLIFGA